jgi:hypothetical protein
VSVLAGPPVDLARWRPDGGVVSRPGAQVLREVTEAVMSEICRLVGELRGEQPPSAVYDPRVLHPATRQRETA